MASESQLPGTGLPDLDRILQGLRAGDNVVWQIGSIDDYRLFIDPFCRAALARDNPPVYFRFAEHPELLREGQARVCRLDPETGFESFIAAILDTIEKAGEYTCYVFDCLSDLAADWHSDRMLGNFFLLACPFLYRLKTIAYFGLLSHHHSFHATDAIEDTAQVILNVHRSGERVLLQPMKVEGRYTRTMFLPHVREGDLFRPATSSATATEIFASAPQSWTDFGIHRPGIWQHTVERAEKTMAEVRAGRASRTEVQDSFQRLVRMAITREPRFLRMARRHMHLPDLTAILQRMIGTGLIGGKSLGMFMARAVLRDAAPDLAARLEAHDSFFVGSDVFYTYLVQNGCWWLRRRQRDPARFLDGIEEARGRILAGSFPDYIERQFAEMLDYFGQSPIIVRSSSLLEDNYGNAFSGKYDSVYCANQGTPRQRLDAFTEAARAVYASAMSEEALTYRAHYGLLDRDEQMALLVQRVSGNLHGNLFFPHLAGVGFSFNPYAWSPEIDPAAGMLRLVFGLGTRAVNRSGDDYTRIVALGAPERRPESAARDIRRYSQRQMDVLDLELNDLVARPVDDGLAGIPARVRELITADDDSGGSAPALLTCERLFADTRFVADMREMLRRLQEAYEAPVDIEFTVNFLEDGSYRVNLLQCRPFQARMAARGGAGAAPAAMEPERTVLRSAGPIIGRSLATPVDRLVYVEPRAYAKLPMAERHALARAIGVITRQPGPRGGPPVILLAGPGRWGTAMPAMGVPVSFAEIRSISALCEIAVMHENLVPDISLGTHFFNDLVEMDILYLAVFPEREGHGWNAELLGRAPSRLREFVPDAGAWAEALRVIAGSEVAPGRALMLHADSVRQRAVCYLE